MLKTLKTAEQLGKRTILDNQNNLVLRDQKPNTILERFRTLFEKKPVGIENREKIVAAVIKKMRNHIETAGTHLAGRSDEIIRQHLPGLGRFAQTGKIGELDDQWTTLQNRLRSDIGIDKENLRDRSKKNRDVLTATGESHSAKRDTNRQPEVSTTSQAQIISDPETIDERIADFNRSLPATMPHITRLGETVIGTMTMPDEDHKQLYRSLEKVKTREFHLESIQSKRSNRIEDDEDDEEYEDYRDVDDDTPASVTISDQTVSDAGRADFVFIDRSGFRIDCGVGSEPATVISTMASICGKTGMSLQTASKLTNQQALITLLKSMLFKFPNAAGNPCLYLTAKDDESEIRVSNSKTSPPICSQSIYTIKECEDGGLEFSLLGRQKIHKWILNDGTILEVNRGPGWEGHINDKNYGLQMSATIKVSAADLEKGSFDNVQIIKPLSLNFRLQPADDREA